MKGVACISINLPDTHVWFYACVVRAGGFNDAFTFAEIVGSGEGARGRVVEDVVFSAYEFLHPTLPRCQC